MRSWLLLVVAACGRVLVPTDVTITVDTHGSHLGPIRVSDGFGAWQPPERDGEVIVAHVLDDYRVTVACELDQIDVVEYDLTTASGSTLAASCRPPVTSAVEIVGEMAQAGVVSFGRDSEHADHGTPLPWSIDFSVPTTEVDAARHSLVASAAGKAVVARGLSYPDRGELDLQLVDTSAGTPLEAAPLVTTGASAWTELVTGSDILRIAPPDASTAFRLPDTMLEPGDYQQLAVSAGTAVARVPYAGGAANVTMLPLADEVAFDGETAALGSLPAQTTRVELEATNALGSHHVSATADYLAATGATSLALDTRGLDPAWLLDGATTVRVDVDSAAGDVQQVQTCLAP